MTNQPLRRRTKSALTLVVAGLIGGLGATTANAAFTDVSGENGYAEHITNVQQAGIATGYNDGSFRPGQGLSRGQAAAWLDRSTSRVGVDFQEGENVVIDDGDPIATLGNLEFVSPAAGGGSGWVTLEGGLGGLVTEGGENCPCMVFIRLRDSSNQELGRGILTLHDGEVATGGSFAVTPLAAGATETYHIEVELATPGATVVLAGGLYGTYSALATGEPESLPTESSTHRRDPVESLVPDVLP